jgi:hypothetical protein
MGNNLLNEEIENFESSYKPKGFEFDLSNINKKRSWWTSTKIGRECWAAYLKLRFNNIINEINYIYYNTCDIHSDFFIFVISKLGINGGMIEGGIRIRDDLFKYTINKYNKQDPEKKFRFIFLGISIQTEGEDSGHANVIILDRVIGRAEYFEPHGSYYIGDKDVSDKIYGYIQNWLNKNWIDYKYFVPPNQLCYKNNGFQALFEMEDKFNPIVKYEGQCQAFVLLYVHLRILMPEVEFNKILEIVSNPKNHELFMKIIYDYFNFMSIFCFSFVDKQDEASLIDLYKKREMIKQNEEIAKMILCSDKLCMLPFINGPSMNNITPELIRNEIQRICNYQQTFLNDFIIKNINQKQSFINIIYKKTDYDIYYEILNSKMEIKKYPSKLNDLMDLFKIKRVNDNGENISFIDILRSLRKIRNFDLHYFIQMNAIDYILENNLQKLSNGFQLSIEALFIIYNILKIYSRNIPLENGEDSSFEIEQFFEQFKININKSINENDLYFIKSLKYLNSQIIVENGSKLQIIDLLSINGINIGKICELLMFANNWIKIEPTLRWNWIFEKSLNDLDLNQKNIELNEESKRIKYSIPKFIKYKLDIGGLNIQTLDNLRQKMNELFKAKSKILPLKKKVNKS